jgi:hypothetical protein
MTKVYESLTAPEVDLLGRPGTWPRMARALLIALVAAFAVPVHANAAAPCRNNVFNDWYADGKIASTYPRTCYADALKHIPPDAAVYSSLADDIRSAMRASLRREAGKKVPAQVGGGFKAASGGTVLATQTTKTKGTPAPKEPHGAVTLAAPPVADTSTPNSGGGLPLPILILGALALGLAALGAIGGGVKYARERRR